MENGLIGSLGYVMRENESILKNGFSYELPNLGSYLLDDVLSVGFLLFFDVGGEAVGKNTKPIQF